MDRARLVFTFLTIFSCFCYTTADHHKTLDYGGGSVLPPVPPPIHNKINPIDAYPPVPKPHVGDDYQKPDLPVIKPAYPPVIAPIAPVDKPAYPPVIAPIVPVIKPAYPPVVPQVIKTGYGKPVIPVTNPVYPVVPAIKPGYTVPVVKPAYVKPPRRSFFSFFGRHNKADVSYNKPAPIVPIVVKQPGGYPITPVKPLTPDYPAPLPPIKVVKPDYPPPRPIPLKPHIPDYVAPVPPVKVVKPDYPPPRPLPLKPHIPDYVAPVPPVKVVQPDYPPLKPHTPDYVAPVPPVKIVKPDYPTPDEKPLLDVRKDYPPPPPPPVKVIGPPELIGNKKPFKTLGPY